MSGHNILFRLLKIILAPFAKRIYKISGPPIEVSEGPNLILSNHATNMDFMILGTMTTCTHMHFVLAENVVRNKFLKWIIDRIDDPIVHVKGANALNTVKEMNKRLKKGRNVMIFPEGNTTFGGLTGTFDESIGKMAKISGANLVLIRIEGGYFTMPRWGKGVRRGKITLTGNTITAEQLKAMSVPEITALINKELRVDEYASNGDRVRYKGRNLARGLERALYICPGCEKIDTLSSRKNKIWCSCGYEETMNEYGELTDSSGGVHKIYDYLSFQKKKLDELASAGSDEAPLFTDSVKVIKMGHDKDKNTHLGKYEIRTYEKKIVYRKLGEEATKSIDFDNIRNVVVFRANTLTVFVTGREGNTTRESVYEIMGDFSFNALKYRDLSEIIRA